MLRNRIISLLLVLVLTIGFISIFPTETASASTQGWIYENNQWYYLQANGTRATGWLNDGGARYYLRSDGIMATGWLRLNNAWYYFSSSGAMATGWLQLGNTWYYFRTNGTMVTGWQNIDNVSYYFHSSGAMATDWQRINNVWYYFHVSGARATGWTHVGNTWYYMRANGTMVTGWQHIHNVWYYFHPSGAMTTGWQRFNNEWYYFHTSGAMATGWAHDGSNWYYMNPNGIMQTGWLYLHDTWYYLRPSGAMLTGWLNDGGIWYFLKSSGAMANDGALANWEWYEFNSSGALISHSEPLPVFSSSTALNPLTGVPMNPNFARHRPLAITLGNTPDALPMNGISRADIVYEVLVEGNATRLLALYQDISTVPYVGSVRSARHYTAQIAESYDAIFVTVGGSYMGYDEIAARGINHVDETSSRFRSMFTRDRNRIPGKVVDNYHSAVTSGALVTRWLPTFGFRMTHSASYSNRLNFGDNVTLPNGRSATAVNVRFTSAKSTSFTYNSEFKVYHMQQFNNEFRDANNNVRMSFSNLLVLKTSVTPVPNDAILRDVVTVGRGTGYFISGGQYVEINWSRENLSSPFVYTLTNGTEITLNRGSTYIAIIPSNMSTTFR
ncbi:MAG: DUF3048 domain-containing protein [Oscillospiraceae bacterium]|jgi:glucan-binding YG repeat protein|nr:DUF3048 domain-containing protein [Oscillospiraceae bacterium]